MTELSPADQVPNHWVRSILSLPHLSDHSVQALAAANLPHDALDQIGAPVPRGTEAIILDFLSVHLDSPFAGAETGMALDPRNSALLTYILFNSKTLSDAVHHVQRFTPVARPQARVELRKASEHIDFIIYSSEPDLRLNAHFIEFALGATLGAFRTATGSSKLASQVGLGNSRKHGQQKLASIYGCPVVLNSTESYLRFPTANLTTPIRNPDTQLLGHLTSYGEVLLSRTRPAPATLAQKIERQLLHGMAEGRPRLSDVAAELGLSERTLNRRLRDEGTSYRDLIRISQLKLAQAFLRDPHLTLIEIAHLCGFCDQSSFTQAYKRWTGNTPRSAKTSFRNKR